MMSRQEKIAPSTLSKTISAFANTDGGELYIGIGEREDKSRIWNGFENEEAANGHIQALEEKFPLGTDYQYQFLRTTAYPGIVLHLEVHKTLGIVEAARGTPYIRRGAQNLPVTTPEQLKRLAYSKGVVSFEAELTNLPKHLVVESEMIVTFVREIVPTSTPEAWLRKTQFLHEDRPTVAGVLLFADEPQALLPKRCGVKVYRYKTTEPEGSRETLDGQPQTIEGCLYNQIRAAVAATIQIVESIPKLGESTFESINYPQETLHEIITNAVLHRDYHVADDVHIRIFDNRIEVQSPGRLPAHITVKNILDERHSRNGAIVRILNKFPDPPNKDVGEGLNTAFEAMNKIGLKAPQIVEKDNSVLVSIRHETLATAEDAIAAYLKENPTIQNKQARKITHIRADYQIKSVFGRMIEKGIIEQVPGTRTASTAYRLVRGQLPPNGVSK